MRTFVRLVGIMNAQVTLEMSFARKHLGAKAALV